MSQNLQTPKKSTKLDSPKSPSTPANDLTTINEDDKFVSEDLTNDNFAFTQLLILTLTLPPITSFSSVITYFGGLGLVDPLFGGYFKNQYTLQFITSSIALGVAVGLSPFFRRPLQHRIPSLLSLASLSMALSPTYATIISTYAEQYGPQWPPHVIYFLSTYSPIFLLSWANATLLYDSLKLFLSTDTWIHGLSLFAFHGSLLVSALGGTLNWYSILPFSGQSATMLLIGSLTLIIYVVIGRWLLFPVNKMGLRTKLAAPMLIIIICLFTQVYHPGCQNRVIPAHHGSVDGYRVLAREESITGWVSVLEEDKRKIRVLRSGHCLLGGIYTEYNESIFHNFYVMDAIHLVKRSKQEDRGKILMIGLGIGSSAEPLIKLNYDVEIVELDPVVYKFAREYFYLSAPSKAHLVDAKQPLVQTPSPLTPPYQFIMHDVFNGAGVDGEYLFTLEALQKVHDLLEPKEGVLALNLVSGLVPPYDTSYIKVTNTLKKVFKYVRCFKEPHDQDETHVKVQNLVFFASNSPINFLPVTHEVYQINEGLAYILDKFENYEIKLDQVTEDDKLVLREDDPKVLDGITAKNQRELMHYHWEGMNKLLNWKTWLIY